MNTEISGAAPCSPALHPDPLAVEAPMAAGGALLCGGTLSDHYHSLAGFVVQRHGVALTPAQIAARMGWGAGWFACIACVYGSSDPPGADGGGGGGGTLRDAVLAWAPGLRDAGAPSMWSCPITKAVSASWLVSAHSLGQQ
jgi:hypothetical protein